MPQTDEEVLQQWEPKVYSFLKGATRSFADAEDLAQELRLTILRAYRKFDPSRGVTFHTYVHAAMMNTRRLFWWRNYQRPIAQENELTDIHSYTNTSSDDTISNDAIDELLTTLTDDERAVVYKLNEGFGLQETRRLLSMRRKTVRDLLTSSQHKIRLVLEYRLEHRA